MKAVLSTGDEVEIIGPVIKKTNEGLFISRREFDAVMNGEAVRISMDELENAKFPDDIEDQIQRAFDDSLTQIKQAWNKLNNLGE
jgi:hypothetical protein